MARYSDSIPRALMDAYPELNMSPFDFRGIQGMKCEVREGEGDMIGEGHIFYVLRDGGRVRTRIEGEMNEADG